MKQIPYIPLYNKDRKNFEKNRLRHIIGINSKKRVCDLFLMRVQYNLVKIT